MNKENYLDKIPKHRGNLKWESDSEKKITLLIENKGLFNRIVQKCFKRPKITQIHLDEMGNFIWPLLDGERSIYDVAMEVRAQYGEKAEPLYERLIKYLQILQDQGFIEI